MFDFLGRNIIAPDSIVNDIKGFRTISTTSDCSLFITHKKLNRESREQGIADPEFVYPITLQLSEINDADGKAVLVNEGESGLDYTFTSLSEYDTEKHIGAYILGEIPFSRVEKIYFDTQEDMDMFSRPSPDYWYPVNKYDLLPDGFNESLSVKADNQIVLEKSGYKTKDIINSIQNREKQRAAILNFINGTKRWQYGKYVFNIDNSLQELYGLKDQKLSDALPDYSDAKAEAKKKGETEQICLVGETLEQNQKINQKIYNHIRDLLALETYNKQKQVNRIVSLLDSLCEEITNECSTPVEAETVRESITEIEKLITDSTDKSPEEIMEGIPESIDVLKAIMFVVKNPNRYDLFLESLDVYHADLFTKRRAAVLWGTLNGLYGMPGEEFNKDNQELWKFIEAIVYKKECQIVPTFSVDMPKVAVDDDGLILGLKLEEEKIVTATEIRNTILAMPKEQLSDSFYDKLLEAAQTEAGSKKKAKNKGYAHSVASVSLHEIKIGENLNDSIKKTLEQLVKDCKTIVPDKDKLFTDYIENENGFNYAFNIDPQYWKNYIK